jgi:hypothetical protein
MAISYVTNALGATNSTTSFSITLPTTAANDILILEFVSRGLLDPTIGGTSITTGGLTWTEKYDLNWTAAGPADCSGRTYWTRCTGDHSGQTVTGSGLNNSCAAVVTQYSGAITTGDPLSDATIVGEDNASGNETQAEITTGTNGAYVVLVVVNSPDLAVTSPACTSPGALTIRAERLSTGGTDTSICHSSAEKATAGATGAFTWSQTDAESGSWAYAIKPAASAASGSGSGTLPIATATGVGKRSLKATGAANLPLVTASGVGKRDLKSTGTGTLPLATATGVGKRALKSTGSGTLPLATASGAGSVTPAGGATFSGSGSGTLPLLTGSGAAVRALKATGSATLPVLTATGTAKRALLGSGSGTLPSLTASGDGGGAVVAPEVDEERSGGYGWANLAAIERRRRKREEEELADALEVAMAAEGLVEPDPVVAARHVVRDYVKTSPPASRRMQRAVEYAYRAQTDLAWQLAAREIARQEEEDFALLMVIAFAA